MADLAFGISKAAVQLVADKVKSAMKEEVEQWKTVERDLVFITGEFEMMQSFLDTADEERVKNKIVSTWVRQVRNLSNDVEDCIDFVLHLETNKKGSWWLRLLPSSSYGKAGAPPPVDEAVAQTTLLRARVVDVSQRNIRYNLIVDSAASKVMAGMDPVHKTAASSFDIPINAIKKSGLLLDLSELITREGRELQVISVCEKEGDLVKVAIVRKAYSESRIHKDFQCRAWVKLMHPLDPQEFLQNVMTQFFTYSCQEQGEVIAGLDALARMQATQSDGNLLKEFAEKVNTHRYLIVLEDLYSMVQWDAIRSYLPDKKNGSRIVVLTHQPVIASQCTGEPCRVSELGQLSPGHCVHVYYKESFQHGRDQSFMKPEPNRSLSNYDLLGRNTEMDELFKLTQNIQQNQHISVWGMPGVGKSALVEAIYLKRKTSGDFERHAWVSVSHPFNPTNFSRSLLKDLQPESTANAFQVKDPIKACRDHLDGCACLFVIDDVRSNEDWDWIKSILIGDSPSCIITITSEESVAKHCAASSITGVLYNVEGLHADAAVNLFNQVFPRESQPYQLETDWRLILPGSCGGLPKVIISVARYLSTMPEKIMHLIDNFMQELATNPEFESLRDILAWMHSYLHNCPRHLKKYMLYLSIFPEDIIIRRRRLVRRWIAEGYSKGTDSNSTEKHADKIFDEVAALKIMQPVLDAESKVIGYRVNGFFREYVISLPVEETILFPVEVCALEGSQGHGRLTTDGIGQHLAVRLDFHNEDHILFANLDLSRLRSFTVFNMKFRLFNVLDRTRVLRVLDLENAKYIFDWQIKKLELPSRLKFLSLRGLKLITELPDSVGDLVQLQTLDIRGTSISTLPPFISKLRKLQYIRAGAIVAWTDDDNMEESTPQQRSSRSMASSLLHKLSSARSPIGSRSPSDSGGVVVPRGIRELQALLEIGVVRLTTGRRKGILSGIVHSLGHLKKLQVSGISWRHRRWLQHWGFTELLYLESLSLQFVKDNHFVDYYEISFPQSLRSLKMHGHVHKLPEHLNNLDNLVKLTLEMTTLFTAEVIKVLGSLQSLHTLRLRVNKDQNGELQFSAADLFKQLQVLEVACKSKLHVRFEEGAVDKVEHLNVHCLRESDMRVSGLEHLVSLKQVWLRGSFDDALKEALQQQLDTHPKRPALKKALMQWR